MGDIYDIVPDDWFKPFPDPVRDLTEKVDALTERVKFLEQREAIRLNSRSPSPYDLTANSGFRRKK